MGVPKYDETFQKTIIELYRNGKPSKDIVNEFRISSSLFYKWVKKYTHVKMPTGESLSIDEIKALQKRTAQLEEENQILKKTLRIFAQV
jgi:transposase-like protein